MDIGEYKVVKQIGEGSFGRTFLGQHLCLPDVKVCIKQEKTTQKPYTDLREEAAIIAKLRHPSLPSFMGYGEYGGQVGQILVLSYIEGTPLDKELEKNGAIHDEHICWIMDRLLGAASYLHGRWNIIHCDIKPGNIILDIPEHNASLVDLGMATVNPVEWTKAKGGTPGFLPPEFNCGLPPIPASDIYSLGKIALVLAGGDPIKGDFPLTWTPDSETSSSRGFGMTQGKGPRTPTSCVTTFPESEWQFSSRLHVKNCSVTETEGRSSKMSGNYGWSGRDRVADYSPPTKSTGFTRAYQPYDNGPSKDAFSQANARGNSQVVPLSQMPAPAMPSQARTRVDLSARKHTACTKKNVIVIAMDRTGSMGEWRKEIFERLALLFKESEKYLGESLEVVFTGFGDLAFGDTFDVAPPGCGPELDDYLIALGKHESGGGNNIESAEIPAYYMLHNVDTSTARNVFYFTITDEGFYGRIKNADVDAVLGLRGGGEESAQVFRDLKVRANVFTLLAQTNTLNGTIKRQWEDAVGPENVVVLDDARRVVDVLLGIIAKLAGAFDQFSQHLAARQGGTQYGKVNVATVFGALSRVVGAPAGPPVIKAGTKSLMLNPSPDPSVAASRSVVLPTTGTKSLL